MSDVLNGTVLVFDRSRAHEIPALRISSLGVVDFRVIHTLSYSGLGGDKRYRRYIDFYIDSAPLCQLGHVMREMLLRVICLRQKFVPHAHAVLSKVDVQASVDSGRCRSIGLVSRCLGIYGSTCRRC